MSAYAAEFTWPIEDPDMPIIALKAEAVEKATQWLHDRGVTPTGRWNLHIKHGAKPTLTCTVQSRGTPIGPLKGAA